MKVRVLYFAKLREQVGVDEEMITVQDTPPPTVATVLSSLRARGGVWETSLTAENMIKCAVNKEFAATTTPLLEAAEVALFPPLTGG